MNTDGNSTPPTRTALRTRALFGEELSEDRRYVLDPATFWSDTPRVMMVEPSSAAKPSTQPATKPATEPVADQQKNSQSSTQINPFHTVSHEISSLRKEIKGIHKAYRVDIENHQRHIHSQSTHIKDLEEMLSNRTSEIISLEHSLIEEEMFCSELGKEKAVLDEEKEKWVGLTLKFQYLFQQMDKIGLQQSEAIFDCFRDIDVPEVCEHIREKFVPTTLTNSYSDDEEEDDDDLSIEDDEDDEDDIINDISMNDLPELENDISRSLLQDIIGIDLDDDEEQEEQEEQEEINATEIELVMNQAQCSREQAINALKKNNSDIVRSGVAAIHNINLRDFNRRDHTFSEVTEMWKYYMDNGILDTITWPMDHLELAAEKFSLDKPDMPRTLKIHLVELCMKDRWYEQAEIMAGIAWAAEDLGWNEVIQKVITIQRIFRGYRARKPWIDVAFP